MPPCSTIHGFLGALLLSCASSLVAEEGFEVHFVPEEFATISDAIEAASDGDIVQIAQGVYHENLSVSSKRISIRGSMLGPTIIDGSKPTNDCGSCVLVTGASELILDQLVLRNGTGCPVYGIRRGGGIYSEFATVELIKVVIEDCSVALDPFGSDSWGGAICNYFGSLVLEGCTIRGNRSDAEGGAIWSSHGDLLMANTALSGNSAVQGGAVLVESGSASFDLSTFRENIAEEAGGGIMVRSEAAVGVYDCRFEANVAANGAAIWSNVTAGTIGNSIFAEQVAGPGGAAVRLDDLNLAVDYLVEGSTFCGTVGEDIIGEWVEGEPNTFEETCRIPADLDGNDIVDGADLTILLGAWGTDGTAIDADLDGNGIVDGGDLAMLLGAWTP